MTNRADIKTKPSFALLDDDDLGGEQASTVESSAAPTPSAQPAPHTQPDVPATPAARPVREVPSMNNSVPQEYMQPELGGIRPLAEQTFADLEARSTRTDLAADAKTLGIARGFGVSKVKLGLTGVCLVAAIAIGMTMFGGHTAAPSAASVTANLTVAAPTTAPTEMAAPTGQAGGQTATPVGVDIGNTAAIALDTGADVDMIEQWAPVAPAEQSCTAGALSPYLQKVCGKVGKAKYFTCAPDGFHWDPRTPGCEQF